jgi:hypothetical protein
MFVDPHLPFLAATPDGLIGDDSIIEIKCPFFIKDLTPLDAYKEKKLNFIYVQSGNLFLKKTHSYYYQTQGQLHITNRKYCYFVVWTPKGIHFTERTIYYYFITVIFFKIIFIRNLCG